MIWTTWRQHRAEAGVGALILAGLATAMLVVGSIARDRARGLGACTDARATCGAALDALHRDFHTIPPFTAALVALPLLAGMFWAAPLVSREYEAGTHRLAWTQSVSPLRWIALKIVLIFGVVAAATLVLGLLATWTLNPLIPAFGGRYNSTWYDIQGIVPVACMLFALAAGVAASALIRRTIPAMAVTLVGYAAARIPIHWIRGHFAPTATRTVTVPMSSVLQNPVPTLRPGDWQQSFTATDASGHSIATGNGTVGFVRHYCPNVVPNSNGEIHIDQACHAVLQNASVTETFRFQPASHFWLVQTVESAIFITAAALLVVAAVLAVTRRRPT
ncbi:MAG TPA: hypothetical protein VGH11_06860 [Jatrophihabitans sp.]